MANGMSEAYQVPRTFQWEVREQKDGTIGPNKQLHFKYITSCVKLVQHALRRRNSRDEAEEEGNLKFMPVFFARNYALQAPPAQSEQTIRNNQFRQILN